MPVFGGQQKLYMIDRVLKVDVNENGGQITVFEPEKGEESGDKLFSFENREEVFCGHKIWDIEAVFAKIREGLEKALERYPDVSEIRLCAWKYDYVLMCGDTELLPCYSHRDERVAELYDFDHGVSGHEGTVVQLMVDLRHGRLQTVTDILMMPEYFAYKLTGDKGKNFEKKPMRGRLKAGVIKGFDKPLDVVIDKIWSN